MKSKEKRPVKKTAKAKALLQVSSDEKPKRSTTKSKKGRRRCLSRLTTVTVMIQLLKSMIKGLQVSRSSKSALLSAPTVGSHRKEEALTWALLTALTDDPIIKHVGLFPGQGANVSSLHLDMSSETGLNRVWSVAENVWPTAKLGDSQTVDETLTLCLPSFAFWKMPKSLLY